MYNSIEIPDSDDEIEEHWENDSKALDISPGANNEHTPEKQTKMLNSSAINLLSSASTATNSGFSPGTSDLGDSPSTSTSNRDSSTASTSQNKQGRHRSRKTQHQAFRVSPIDMQFETVALDDDTEESPAVKIRKLQTDGPVDKVKTAILNMLETPEMEETIQRIAKERVRCNFLLATYQLPDISFNLNTSAAVLKMQFRERLRKRKDKDNANVTAADADSAATSTSPTPSKKTPSLRTKLVQPQSVNQQK